MKKMVIGILAHVDSGKTTLSESMLYVSGKVRRLGRVDHGDAFLDTYELEKSRGITIFSKQAVFELGDKSVTLLDTPGHVDFSGDGTDTSGTGLCNLGNQRSRRCAGTYPYIVESASEISDTSFSVCE